MPTAVDLPPNSGPRAARRWIVACLLLLSLVGSVPARADEPAAAESAPASAPVEKSGDAASEPAQSPVDSEANAADEAGEQQVNFTTEVQPIFINYCYRCHSADRRSGGLRLDKYDEAKAGGDSGRPILGGTLETNELYKRVASTERAYRMPKNADALPSADVATIKRWVEQGAEWPSYARGEAKNQITPDGWIIRAVNWLDQYQDEVAYAKPFAVAFVLAQLGILIIARCRTAYQDGRPWTTGRARRWCAFCGRISGRELLLMWLVLAMCVPLVILRGHERRLASEVKQLRIVKTSTESPWYATIYGFPPKPVHPDQPRQLEGTYYRGNCERNPALFNGGNYLTAVFRIGLRGPDGQPLKFGDAVPTGGLFLHFEIERAPNTTELLYTKDLMEGVCLSEKFNDVEPVKPIPQPIRLHAVQDGYRWAADYPLGELGANDVSRGVIYIYMGFHNGAERFAGDPHYAIGYDVTTVEGKLSGESDIWMNSFGNSVFENPTPPGKLPYREWFDFRPIPPIEGENTKDPKLLGVDEYVKKGLIPPPAAAGEEAAKGAENSPDETPETGETAPQSSEPNQEAK